MNPMAKRTPNQTTSPDILSSYEGALQIPVDTRILGITLSDALTPLLKIVATGSTSTSSYDPGFEYWHDNKLEPIDRYLDLNIINLTPTPDKIPRFLRRFDPSFRVKQKTSSPWSDDPYSPAFSKKNLFYGRDPDNNGESFIAVLIEQDDNNYLKRITWFKQDEDAESIFNLRTVDDLIDGRIRLRLMLAEAVYDNNEVDLSRIDSDPWYHSPMDALI